MLKVTSDHAKISIEKLLRYGVINELIDEWDIVQIRNGLLELFEIDEPYYGKVHFEATDDFHIELNQLMDYAVEKGIIPEDTCTYRDLFGTKIMGLLTPRQSEVIKKFKMIQQNESIEAATKYYYAFSQTTNYIRVDRIKENLSWKTQTEFGELNISVNLSKPEKDPKEIAKIQLSKQSGYPKCLLCLENVGYAGRLNHPARHNHRVIPLNLGDEQWYFQYSPYSYYNEHCILFSEQHKPMKIDRQALMRMLDFVEQFPHYFIGANAGLPIVGGSILNHDHYQGGRATFPIENAELDLQLIYHEYPNVKISTRKWCMSFIRLAGQDKEQLLELASYIFDKWKEYSDESVDILAYSKNGNEMIPHNAITPIVRKTADNAFEIDLVLRNNRTSDEHPDGIFHPHKELHHIKKENIGVIEVMGLAILPGRLDKELKAIKEILCGQVEYPLEAINDSSHILHKHQAWIEELIDKYSRALSIEEVDRIMKDEVGYKFLATLLDSSVFKNDKKGKDAFEKFLLHMGFEVV